jgi:spermidine/putrescine ABC transporter ATP-binding subunit
VKKFKTKDESVLALNRVSAEVKEGELFCLLGPSGCGKTTLLRCTAGLETVSEGKIYYGDQDFSLIPPYKRNIGMVFQNYALYPHMTVFENVAYALRIRKTPNAEIKRKVEAIMDLVGLPGVLSRSPNELSGGQQQRVALARALVYEPEVLLLDEPLANLDAKLKVQMRSEIRRIQKASGVTTIYVTHDQLEAMAISDRLAIMEKGNICQIGTPGEIYSNPLTRFIAGFIGTMNFFEGRLEPSGNGFAVMVGGNRKEVAAPMDGGRLQDALNGPVDIAVRPEHIQIRPQEDKAPGEGFSGYVQILQFLGKYVRYHVVAQINGEEKVVQVDLDMSAAYVREGDRVVIDFSAGSILLFHEGERIV